MQAADGVLHTRELFPGLLDPNDGCTDTCKTPNCGDGVLDPDEACDDGNDDDSDACLSTCAAASCGDGYVQADVEACDDGNAVNTDDCLDTCVIAQCGDGVVWVGHEQCDDANAVDTDSCLADCSSAGCGDGYLWAGQETCDDGNLLDTDACPSTCEDATCGDGFVWQDNEECDDANAVDTDACVSTCEAATCGDGHVWAGNEECDDANMVNTDSCVEGCSLAECGDGYVGPGEGCDDGNLIPDDGCTDTCKVATCGDGVVDPGETCDDGNIIDIDSCTSGCVPATCGDGLVWSGNEDCDDANPDNTDDCLDSCEWATCGDGALWAGHEQCDDGNLSNGDACLASCVPAGCGDGHVWMGQEQCDDGNTVNVDACTNACVPATCGDGIVWTGQEECDDGNVVNGDGCESDCTITIQCGDGVFNIQELCWEWSPAGYIGTTPFVTRFRVGDVDGDGNLDFTAERGAAWGTLPLFWGNADGTFVSPGVSLYTSLVPGLTPYHVDLGDLDLDGDMDIVIGYDDTASNTQNPRIGVRMSNGPLRTFDETIHDPTNTLIRSMAVSAWTAGGYPGIATTERSVYSNEVWNASYLRIDRGNGDGTFIWDAIDEPFEEVRIVAIDLDQDGNTEIWAEDRSPNSTRVVWCTANNTGDCGPTGQMLQGINSAVFADINEDGHLDAIGVAARTLFGLPPDNNGPAFAPPVQLTGGDWGYGGRAIADVDNDGHLDIIHPYQGNLAIRLGDGTGDFPPIEYVLDVTPTGNIESTEIEAADFNHDGIVDFLITNVEPEDNINKRYAGVMLSNP